MEWWKGWKWGEKLDSGKVWEQGCSAMNNQQLGNGKTWRQCLDTFAILNSFRGFPTISSPWCISDHGTAGIPSLIPRLISSFRIRKTLGTKSQRLITLYHSNRPAEWLQCPWGWSPSAGRGPSLSPVAGRPGTAPTPDASQDSSVPNPPPVGTKHFKRQSFVQEIKMRSKQQRSKGQQSSQTVRQYGYHCAFWTTYCKSRGHKCLS